MNLWFQGRGLNTAHVVNISTFFMKSKAQLRQFLTRQRQALTTQQLHTNSRDICHRISQHFFSPPIPINYAIYWPFGHEVDLRALLKKYPNGHVPSVFKQQMQFQPWSPETILETHALGMKQPPYIQRLSPIQLTICFLPLLGFDDQGHRLGMGGGFYDRFFEHINDVQLVGVAHNCQQVDALPTDEWDVKLDAIVTESQLITP